jgi:hypothetical protein
MYMVANVHGWTSDRKFEIPFLDIVVGEEEARLEMTPADRQVVARRAVARVAASGGQRRRPRRNFTILRHAGNSANSVEKALIYA